MSIRQSRIVTIFLLFPGIGVLDVNGSLQANGTMTAPVTFTSANNLPGGWTGILVEDAGSAYLSHSVVHNATGNNIEVRGSAARLLLENSLVTGSTDRGISLSAGQITAVCSTITANQGDGIYVDGSGTPVLTISTSAITDNGETVCTIPMPPMPPPVITGGERPTDQAVTALALAMKFAGLSGTRPGLPHQAAICPNHPCTRFTCHWYSSRNKGWLTCLDQLTRVFRSTRFGEYAVVSETRR